MKKTWMITVWVILVLLVFAACGREELPSEIRATDYYSEAAEKSSKNPDSTVSFAEKTITVETLVDATMIKQAAGMFEAETGIHVTVVENIDPTALEVTDGDIEQYEEKAVTDLMAGKGSDIYDVRYLDYANLGKRGMLEDLKGWIDENPALSDEAVFQNLLLSAETADGVFGIPTSFMARKLAANSAQEPEIPNERMTWTEFFDTVRDLPTQSVAYDGTELGIFNRRFETRVGEFIDESSGEETLNSPEMIAMLEECAAWRDEGLCRDSREDASEEASYTMMIVPPGYEAQYLCDIPNYVPELSLTVAPMISDAENPADVDASTVELYGVNASSENKEEALQFLEFLLSQEFQETLALGTPINREAFQKTIDTGLDRIASQAGDTIDINKEESIAKAEAFVDGIGKMVIPRPYYETLVQESAQEYFMGQISAEEAAQRMSEKVSLYLKEIG